MSAYRKVICQGRQMKLMPYMDIRWIKNMIVESIAIPVISLLEDYYCAYMVKNLLLIILKTNITIQKL